MYYFSTWLIFILQIHDTFSIERTGKIFYVKIKEIQREKETIITVLSSKSFSFSHICLSFCRCRRYGQSGSFCVPFHTVHWKHCSNLTLFLSLTSVFTEFPFWPLKSVNALSDYCAFHCFFTQFSFDMLIFPSLEIYFTNARYYFSGTFVVINHLSQSSIICKNAIIIY
jgi:hypothetical protein